MSYLRIVKVLMNAVFTEIGYISDAAKDRFKDDGVGMGLGLALRLCRSVVKVVLSSSTLLEGIDLKANRAFRILCK